MSNVIAKKFSRASRYMYTHNERVSNVPGMASKVGWPCISLWSWVIAMVGDCCIAVKINIAHVKEW